MAVDLASLGQVVAPKQQVDMSSLPAGAQASAAAGGMLSNIASDIKTEQKQSALQQAMPEIMRLANSGDYKGAMNILGTYNPEIFATQLAKDFGLEQQMKIDPKTTVVEGATDQFAVQQGPGGALSATGLGVGKAPPKTDPALDYDRTYRRKERHGNTLGKLQDKSLETMQNVRSAREQAKLALHNPQAALNLGRSIIKAIEGAGARVSNEDFKTALGDGSLAGQAARTYERLANGTITEREYKDVLSMIDAMEQVYDIKIKQRLRDEVRKYAKRSNISMEEAYYDSELPLESYEMPFAGDIIERGGKKWQFKGGIRSNQSNWVEVK